MKPRYIWTPEGPRLKDQHFPLPPDALPLPYPQTPQSAYSLIKLEGLCVSEIARVTGIDRNTFTDLLSGKQKGLRGNAHRAAILLGLKPAPARTARRRGAAANTETRAAA